MAVAAAGDITMLSHTIGGYSEGLLLAMAAAFGVVVGLLLIASASMTRPRRAHRRRPADLESIRWAGSTAADRVTVASHQLAERHAEPLYEEAKRAARLWSDSDLVLLSADDWARSWRTDDEYVRPS